MTTKHQVIAVHKAHPDWDYNRIATVLECPPSYVRATARRNNLPIPNVFEWTPKKCEERAADLRAQANQWDLRAQRLRRQGL